MSSKIKGANAPKNKTLLNYGKGAEDTAHVTVTGSPAPPRSPLEVYHSTLLCV